MAVSQEVEVRHALGLHARPASAFVKTASEFASRITVENITRSTKAANGKSIMSVMLASVKKNDHIVISAEGEDEKAAVNALVELINSNFGETE